MASPNLYSLSPNDYADDLESEESQSPPLPNSLCSNASLKAKPAQRNDNKDNKDDEEDPFLCSTQYSQDNQYDDSLPCGQPSPPPEDKNSPGDNGAQDGKDEDDEEDDDDDDDDCIIIQSSDEEEKITPTQRRQPSPGKSLKRKAVPYEVGPLPDAQKGNVLPSHKEGKRDNASAINDEGDSDNDDDDVDNDMSRRKFVMPPLPRFSTIPSPASLPALTRWFSDKYSVPSSSENASKYFPPEKKRKPTIATPTIPPFHSALQASHVMPCTPVDENSLMHILSVFCGQTNGRMYLIEGSGTKTYRTTYGPNDVVVSSCEDSALHKVSGTKKAKSVVERWKIAVEGLSEPLYLFNPGARIEDQRSFLKYLFVIDAGWLRVEDSTTAGHIAFYIEFNDENPGVSNQLADASTMEPQTTLYIRYRDRPQFLQDIRPVIDLLAWLYYGITMSFLNIIPRSPAVDTVHQSAFRAASLMLSLFLDA